jgi:hypothetical protein
VGHVVAFHWSENCMRHGPPFQSRQHGATNSFVKRAPAASPFLWGALSPKELVPGPDALGPDGPEFTEELRHYLVLPEAVTTLTFPIYDFDEGAVLSFRTPEESGTTYAVSGGKHWSLVGASIRYRGDGIDGEEHLPENVAIITASNPEGFTALEMTSKGPAGVGIGDLQLAK